MLKIRNKTKSLIPIISILLTIVLSVTFSYSWIIGDLTPSVKGKFKVSSQAGITLAVGSEGAGTIIDMNPSGEDNLLELPEVSSPNGYTFFCRNLSKYYEDSLGNEINTFTRGTVSDTQIPAYREVSFTIKVSFTETTSDYYLYFIDGGLSMVDTYHTAFTFSDGRSTGSLQALRCSIIFNKPTAFVQTDYPLFTRTYGDEIYNFFGNATENTLSHDTSYITSIKSQKITYNGNQVTENVIDTIDNTIPMTAFSTASIDPYGNGSGVGTWGYSIPNPNYLMKIDKTQLQFDVTVRVWLEGGSNYCNEAYLGTDRAFDLGLFFVIYEVKQQVSA